MYENDGYEYYYLRLCDNTTGDIEDITYRYPNGYAEDAIAFYWTDGNGGCDCNRMLEFYKQRNMELKMSRFCGTNRMALLGIWRARDGIQIVASEIA